MVLKRMKRRHSRGDALAVDRKGASACARPARDITLGADLIAGFPTEDRGHVRQHRWPRSQDLGLTFLHVFPYLGRAQGHAGGTHAAGAR